MIASSFPSGCWAADWMDLIDKWIYIYFPQLPNLSLGIAQCWFNKVKNKLSSGEDQSLNPSAHFFAITGWLGSKSQKLGEHQQRSKQIGATISPGPCWGFFKEIPTTLWCSELNVDEGWKRVTEGIKVGDDLSLTSHILLEVIYGRPIRRTLLLFP